MINLWNWQNNTLKCIYMIRKFLFWIIYDELTSKNYDNIMYKGTLLNVILKFLFFFEFFTDDVLLYCIVSLPWLRKINLLFPFKRCWVFRFKLTTNGIFWFVGIFLKPYNYKSDERHITRSIISYHFFVFRDLPWIGKSYIIESCPSTSYSSLNGIRTSSIRNARKLQPPPPFYTTTILYIRGRVRAVWYY